MHGGMFAGTMHLHRMLPFQITGKANPITLRIQIFARYLRVMRGQVKHGHQKHVNQLRIRDACWHMFAHLDGLLKMGF